MKARCFNPNRPAFKDYGERGISVCERWLKFSNFYADMGEPEEGMTLERVKNEEGYSPENCKWATAAEQGLNKRNNVLVTIDGETLVLSQWCERLGLKYATVLRRIHKGWRPVDALIVPIRKFAWSDPKSKPEQAEAAA
jgi:hypothetical protein